MFDKKIDSERLEGKLLLMLRLGDCDLRELAFILKLTSAEISIRMRHSKDYRGQEWSEKRLNEKPLEEVKPNSSKP